MSSTNRRTAAQLKVPEPPQETAIGPGAEKKKRGSLVTKTVTSMEIASSGLQQGKDPGKMRHDRQNCDIGINSEAAGKRTRTSNSDHDGQLRGRNNMVELGEWNSISQPKDA